VSDHLDFAELKASGNLPSPKGVALTVMELCQRENVSLTEVAHIIRGDPALAGRIIKIANAINPNKRRPIASVSPETLIIIGTNTVQQIVLGFSLVNAKRHQVCKEFNYQEFWSRSIATACATQAIGETTRLAPAAEMFTCGLLSNVGRIGLAAVRPEAYSDILRKTARQSSDVLAAAETERFGMNHRDLNNAMMEDWGIPKFYAEAVLFHENPEESWFQPGSRQRKLTDAIHLASLIAEACLTTDNDARNALIPHICELGDELDIEIVQMISIADQTAREWHEWGELLNTPTPVLPPFLPPQHLAADTVRKHMHADPMRILVVDDEMIAMIFSKLLGNVGHHVFTTNNGQEALQIAKREHPQVVISDWLSPDMDGAALCRALRDDEATRDAYFIMLTSLDDDQKRAEAARAGANAYLHKPFDPKEINAELLKAQKLSP
jgi:HD-like signal output (HDOD) protein/ActR/RegA family two-component response regulator